MKEILERSNVQLAGGWRALLWAMVLIGALTFVVGLALGDRSDLVRAWQALLLNTLFWGGIAQAGVMLSVIWTITYSRWGRPFKRVAEGFGAFLPVTFLLFLLVFFGGKYLYEWVEHPMPVKAGWLNLHFFISRNVVSLLLMYGISYFYVFAAVKPDLALARKLIPGWGGGFADRILRGYGEPEQEAVRLEELSRRLAPLLGVVYAAVMSLVAFDFVMSLDQEWYSTLFGVFFFVGGLYSALALLLVVIAALRNKPGLAEYMTINRYHDLGKLTFAIAMLYTYMAFSQYLVIWYSNLPEEAPFLVSRSLPGTPWFPLFWALAFVLFLFPFLGLMPRTVCRNPKIAVPVALILLVGQWFAHYLLVVPSIQDRTGHPAFVFGAIEVLETVGVAGAFFLSFFAFMRRVPILPIADKYLTTSFHGH
ncbi:MAG: molybdopterin oxidoreductase [Candidatus Lambdaproteobacteria bacterium]|nr:molybdopterin oxidoreductase [Candidatus Lambdaproteobacteria bacterium]